MTEQFTGVVVSAVKFDELAGEQVYGDALLAMPDASVAAMPEYTTD